MSCSKAQINFIFESAEKDEGDAITAKLLV